MCDIHSCGIRAVPFRQTDGRMEKMRLTGKMRLKHEKEQKRGVATPFPSCLEQMLPKTAEGTPSREPITCFIILSFIAIWVCQFLQYLNGKVKYDCHISSSSE